ncbi:MAG: 23S rRNA (uracil(1939)-C(5))-methyltransferase RlmD [Chloroflexota bacterium]
MGQVIDLELTDMAYGGAAVGRREGRVVFVPYAIAGERVRVEIVEEKKRYAQARLMEILTPSPDRVQPPCPHFGPGPEGPCGSCQWQHIAYPAQVRFKQAILADQLRRIGGFSDLSLLPPVPSPSPWAYRNQARFGVSPDGRLGYRAMNSQRILPIRECHIIDPRLLTLFQSLDLEPAGLNGVTLRVGTATDELMLVLEVAGDERPAVETDLPLSCVLQFEDGSSVVLVGEGDLMEEVAGRRFQVSAGSFFQVNTPLAEKLVERVLNYLALTGRETVLEAYSGVGLFTAFLAPQAARVIAIESNPSAVADAQINLDEFNHIELYQAEAEEVLPVLEVALDAAVLDPPRTGCAPAVMDALIRLRPSRLVYVSCDPATLARDCRRLAAGGYRLAATQLVDMFPQTYHIESVSLLIAQD